LQAPIVILADAADDPDSSPPRAGELVEEVLGRRRKVPLPPLRKEEKAKPVRDAEQIAAAQEREEHWRLLYVAMTRAEEALFIAGTLRKGKTELPADSWFARLEPLLGEGEALDDPLWGTRREHGSLPPWPAARAAVAEGPAPALPPWALTAIGPEPRPPRPLAPSSLGEEEAPDPPYAPGPAAAAAARRGTLIHKLIERLPDIPDERRVEAAQLWLARVASDLSPEEREDIARGVQRVLAQPAWEDVFGPASLAEVPLVATVGGRVIAGTVDRLVVTGETVRVVDFKTGRRPPDSVEQIAPAYLRQMAAYAAALEVIYPDRQIEAALLYTHKPELFVIPTDLLAAHKLD
jgi:ATP-dependent helicase/nuclease subunit A